MDKPTDDVEIEEEVDVEVPEVEGEVEEVASSVKVPEAFQQKVADLLSVCNTPAYLNYLSAEIDEARAALTDKPADAEFSMEEMPE